MMQNSYNSQYQTDVYAGIETAPSANTFAESQEFSLAAISEKLGGNIAQTIGEITTTSPDLMPTNQTINMTYARNYAPESAVTTKMSSKTKAIAITYVAVVLMLVLAVTLCGVSVGGSFATAVAVDAQYSELSNEIAELTTLAGQEDYAELVERAESLGYVDASASNTHIYTEVETRPVQNIAIQTNWFDSLCDWVCGVFGA